MSPTPKQIASMTARGWQWVPVKAMFAGPPGTSALGLAIYLDNGVWSIGLGPRNDGRLYDTAEIAADALESWLRAELGALRFPWLKVDPAGA